MLWGLGLYLFLMLPTVIFDSRFGEEHPLVRRFYTNLSLYGSLFLTSSATIQHILSALDAFVAYFYFNLRDDNKKYRHNLLPSLPIQLTARSKTCRDILSHVYSAHGKGTQQPSDKDGPSSSDTFIPYVLSR